MSQYTQEEEIELKQLREQLKDNQIKLDRREGFADIMATVEKSIARLGDISITKEFPGIHRGLMTDYTAFKIEIEGKFHESSEFSRRFGKDLIQSLEVFSDRIRREEDVNGAVKSILAIQDQLREIEKDAGHPDTWRQWSRDFQKLVNKGNQLLIKP